MAIKALHEWHAEGYHLNSSAQSKAAMNILQYAEFKGNEHVLDVGCGDGKITARLANFLKSGSVHGIDASPEMIEFAKKTYHNSLTPNLRFSLLDATQLCFNEEFDVLFSSFTMLWVLNQNLFLQGAYKSLKPDGRLIITTPLEFSLTLETVANDVITRSKWAPYFRSFIKSWNFVGKEKYTDLLEEHQFISIRIDEVIHEEIFSSREDLQRYVHQWFPYFGPIPNHLRESFFNEVMEGYFVLEPALKDGKAILKFSRLDLVAKKASFGHRK